jgi:hypothetical protein
MSVMWCILPNAYQPLNRTSRCVQWMVRCVSRLDWHRKTGICIVKFSFRLFFFVSLPGMRLIFFFVYVSFWFGRLDDCEAAQNGGLAPRSFSGGSAGAPATSSSITQPQYQEESDDDDDDLGQPSGLSGGARAAAGAKGGGAASSSGKKSSEETGGAGRSSYEELGLGDSDDDSDWHVWWKPPNDLLLLFIHTILNCILTACQCYCLWR